MAATSLSYGKSIPAKTLTIDQQVVTASEFKSN
jgi:hypothetical protein